MYQTLTRRGSRLLLAALGALTALLLLGVVATAGLNDGGGNGGIGDNPAGIAGIRAGGGTTDPGDGPMMAGSSARGGVNGADDGIASISTKPLLPPPNGTDDSIAGGSAGAGANGGNDIRLAGGNTHSTSSGAEDGIAMTGDRLDPIEPKPILPLA